MKKFISLILVGLMMFSSISLPVAFADGSVTVESYNFNESFDVPSQFSITTPSTGTRTIEIENLENAPTYDNVLKLTLQSSPGWTDFYWNTASYETGDNIRTEVEFDMQPYGVKTAGYSYVQFRLLGAASYPITITSTGSIKLYSTSGKEVETLGQMPSTWVWGDEMAWFRFKIVLEKSIYNVNGTDYTIQKIAGLYVNGNDVLKYSSESTDPAFNRLLWGKIASDGTVSAGSNSAFRGINFVFSSKAALSGLRLDNLHVVKYDKTQMTMPDRSAFIASIRKAWDAYKTSYEQYGAVSEYAEIFEAYRNSLNSAFNLYNNFNAIQAEFDSKIVELNGYAGELVGSYTPVPLWNDDFSTDTSSMYNKHGDAVLSIDSTKGALDPTLGNMLEMSRNGDLSKSAYPRVSFNFNLETGEHAALTDGKNAFAEIEFDINIDKRGSQNTAIFLKDTVNSVNVFSLLIGNSGELFYGYDDNAKNNPELVQVPLDGFHYDFTKTNRIKFVIQTTDERGVAIQMVNGIYLNGENMLPAPVKFTNVSSTSTCEFTDSSYINRLFFSPSKIEAVDDYKLYIDNIKINKYKLKNANDPSPVRDTYPLVAAIRKKVNEKSIAEASPERYASVMDSIVSSIAQLTSLYNNPSASDSDIAAALQVAEQVTAAMNSCNIFVIADENFENSSGIISGGEIVSDNTYQVGKALKVTSSASGSFNKTYLFDNENQSYSASQHGANVYVMTEFEVKTEGFVRNSNAVLNVKMQGADNSDVNVINLAGGDKPSINLKIPGGYKRYNALEDGKWYTIRLVTSITGADKAAVKKNVKLYIDGNNLLSLTNTDAGEDIIASESAMYYDKILFDVTGGTAYIDNINVIRFYGSESEPVNYAQLLASIRKGDNKISRAIVGNNVTADIYNTFVNALTEAKAVYERNATLSEVEVANDILCQAYSKFLFKDESVNIGAVYFADIEGNEVPYLVNKGVITGVSLTKKAEYGYLGSLIVALYNRHNELVNVEVVPNVLMSMAVNERKIVPFNLSLPDDVTDHIVKVMLFNTMEDISPITKSYVPTNESATIYIAGDSIVQSYGDDIYPRDGWGKYVGNFYNNVNVVNLAVSGYTTRMFIDEQKMKIVEENIKPGDYLMVSFMANDNTVGSIKRVDRYDYKNLLRYYSDVASRHGAQVVFVTSPARLSTTNSGSYGGGYGNGYYPQLMRDVAAEVGAHLIDLYQKRIDLQTEKGYNYVESAMYLCNIDTLKLNFTDKEIKESKFESTDKTHLSIWGAKKCASWVAEEMKNVDCGLRYYTNGVTFDFPENFAMAQ